MKSKYFIQLIFVAFILNIVGCRNNAGNNNQASDTDTANNNATAAPLDIAADSSASGGAIAIDKLPATVKLYMEKNYAGYTISTAVHDPLCIGGDAIDVAITKPGHVNLSLIFIPDGTFVQKEEDVPLNTAPAKVRDMVKTKYAAYTAGNQIEKLTLADNTIEYLVDIAKGNVTKEVIMSTDGKVVCEK